jgi:predicted dehydrogenase
VAGNEVRVAMIGHAFMGGTHSVAWRSVNRAFDLPLEARMSVLCGQDAQRAEAAAARLGWAESSADWREVVARDDIDLIDICTPGDNHAEVAIAALNAGKHVLCEKPLANTVAEAEAMVAAAVSARARGVRSMCGFNYRRTPAVALMRQIVTDGRIGDIRHVRARYLQDWIVDPQFPLVWRLQKDRAGSGALGDIGAHIIDLTQHVTGQSITSVSAMTETFVKKRPLPGSTTLGEVTVDDAALFLVRLDGGAVGTYEATRFATGHKNGLSIELNGSLGSVIFDFERMNELQFHDATVPAGEAGFTRILVTEPTHPYLEGWWPPGHPIGYEHTFTHEVRDLLADIAAGTDPTPSFADALQVQRVLDAVERSAADGVWTTVEPVLA